MVLPEEDPTTIGLLVDYLYTSIFHLLPAKAEGDDKEEDKELQTGLISLYLFAEKINDAPLMNATIDAVQLSCYTSKLIPKFPLVSQVYENTKPTSKLRLLTLEMYIYGSHSGWTPDELHDVHSYTKDNEELFIDFVNMVSSLPFLMDPLAEGKEKEPCRYHTGGCGPDSKCQKKAQEKKST